MNHHRHRGRGRRFGHWDEGGNTIIAGPHLHTGRMVSSSDLQLAILWLLKERPQHGYDIIKAFEERSLGLYSPSPGMIYPALAYLEDASYACSEAQGSKKVYCLTDPGQAYFEENRAAAAEILKRLENLGRKMALMQEYYEENEPELADIYSDSRGRRSWKMELHELRHELRAALRAKFEASDEEKQRVKAILKNAILEIQKTEGKGS